MRITIALAIILSTTLLVAPKQGVGQQPAMGDLVSIRRSYSQPTPERRWGVEPARPRWTEATVVRLANDTLWYRASGQVAQLPVGDAEVRRPTGRDKRAVGMVLGAVTGGVIGGLIAYHTFEPEHKIQGGFGAIGSAMVCAINGCNVPQSNTRSGDTWAGIAAGAGFAGLAGYFIGKATGRWESIDLTPTVAHTGTASLNLRVGF